MAILEIAPVTDALRSAITRRAAAAELVHMARESGISSLWDSGMHHVLAGATSLAELLDHVSPPETGDAAPQEDIDALLSQLLDSMAKDKKKNAPSPAPAAKLEFDV
jgi:hypothetical protein